MSKKAEPSLTRYGNRKLRNLYHHLTKALPVLATGDGLRDFCDSSRHRAFNGVESYKIFKHLYVRSQVLKKYQKGTISAKARKATAVAGFLESETVCRETNSRLHDAFNRPSAMKYWSVLKRARTIVAAVLGRYDIEEHLMSCDFSSGASTELPRSPGSVSKKWELGTHVTERALPYALAFVRGVGLDDATFRIVDSNKVFTVLKNFEKDRTCAKEPTWNMFLQKGLGNVIRARLNRKGLLHPDAQVTHQVLARQASIDGRLTTDDLSAASDSIAAGLVELLLPDEWMGPVWDTRSDKGTLPDGTVITYEKISSMGNGYTFELETLLFYALVRAVCGKDSTVSVYGDDLIYPSSYVTEVRELLSFCGFSTNVEKSFASGPFRESCGGHYFRGHDVTPFYLEKLPTNTAEVIELHNSIVSYHSNMPPNQRWLAVARECRKLVDRRFWGPYGTSGTLWAEWDEARPYYVKRYQAFAVSAVSREMAVQVHDYFRGSLRAKLWSSGEQQPVLPRANARSSWGWWLINRPWRPERVVMSEIQFPHNTRLRVRRRIVGSNRWATLPVSIPAC